MEYMAYIAKELYNQSAAENLMSNIELSIMSLREFPYSCSLVKDKHLMDKGYRKIVIDNYIGFYDVDDTKNEVIIMRIHYGRRKYQDIIRRPYMMDAFLCAPSMFDNLTVKVRCGLGSGNH